METDEAIDRAQPTEAGGSERLWNWRLRCAAPPPVPGLRSVGCAARSAGQIGRGMGQGNCPSGIPSLHRESYGAVQEFLEDRHFPHLQGKIISSKVKKSGSSP